MHQRLYGAQLIPLVGSHPPHAFFDCQPGVSFRGVSYGARVYRASAPIKGAASHARGLKNKIPSTMLCNGRPITVSAARWRLVRRVRRVRGAASRSKRSSLTEWFAGTGSIPNLRESVPDCHSSKGNVRWEIVLAQCIPQVRCSAITCVLRTSGARRRRTPVWREAASKQVFALMASPEFGAAPADGVHEFSVPVSNIRGKFDSRLARTKAAGHCTVNGSKGPPMTGRQRARKQPD
jgi:hypothetical protein